MAEAIDSRVACPPILLVGKTEKYINTLNLLKSDT